jgi:hypothetical protein
MVIASIGLLVNYTFWKSKTWPGELGVIDGKFSKEGSL